MFPVRSLVLTACWVALVRSQVGSQRSRGVGVLVSSARNHSGHWTSQVTLVHDNAVTSETAVTSVEVQPSISTCSGAGSTYVVTFTITTSPATPQTSGYEHFPGLGHYKFHGAGATWPRAREVCDQEGGHLLIINSEEESKMAVKLFAQNPNVTADYTDWGWIGMREMESVNGQYFTIFGKSLASTGFTRWYPGQPDETTPGDFMTVNGKTGGIGDHGTRHNSKMPFICEQQNSC